MNRAQLTDEELRTAHENAYQQAMSLFRRASDIYIAQMPAADSPAEYEHLKGLASAVMAAGHEHRELTEAISAQLNGRHAMRSACDAAYRDGARDWARRNG